MGNYEGEETDDFYEFTAEDYYRLLATKREGNGDTNHYIWAKKLLCDNWSQVVA